MCVRATDIAQPTDPATPRAAQGGACHEARGALPRVRRSRDRRGVWPRVCVRSKEAWMRQELQ